MYSEIARKRLSAVVRPDSITSSEGDFMATHVPTKKLMIVNKYEISPKGKYLDEEYIFNNVISNPDDIHQFIAVYGQSGTGKSHLIRWFQAMYEQKKPENEVILFIRRSDNTLKGTIKQLLEKPEVKNIRNKDLYERLVKATTTEDPKKLKELILHKFIIEANNDIDDYDIKLTNVMKKKLVAFLSNDIIQEYLLRNNGPIERIYSKVAEATFVDRDIIAEFYDDDFIVTSDLYENIENAEADRKVRRLANELLSDEKGPETSARLARYLNQFKNSVIQSCAGIEAGDFRQVFIEIRKELYRLNKKLTVFIEDVTSFTGVDTALLDALMEDHNGKRDGASLCRISSIVGTTNNYLEHNFKDNHRDRISKYIYIPDDIFDEKGLYEFVGRYVNTMSLTEEEINSWMKVSCEPTEYPVHELIEGKGWESISIKGGKELNLYPFTKKAIMYFYNNILEKGHRTPRYVIRYIIEPIVHDAIFKKNEFPSLDIKLLNIDTALNFRIHNQINDTVLSDRLLKFMSVWGNGDPIQYVMDGELYIAGLNKKCYEDFNLPVIKMNDTDVPKREEPLIQPNQIEHEDDTHEEISNEKRNKVNEVHAVLTKWTNEKVIDISPTGGATGRIRKVVYDDIKEFIFKSINWQCEGISANNAQKVKESNELIVSLEGQTKRTGMYEFPATWNSLSVLMAFIKKREYGNGTWDYPDADFDVFLTTTWLESAKKHIVKSVREYKENVPSKYIEPAIVSEMYRIILTGQYGEKSLKNFNTEVLLTNNIVNKANNTYHCSEWKSLLKLISEKNADKINREVVLKYFNLIQGSGGSKIVLNPLGLSNVFKKVKRNRLKIAKEEMQTDDKIRQRRDIYLHMQDIVDRIETVSKSELKLGLEKVEQIYNAFGDDEIEEYEINEFIDRIKKFYNSANNAQINVREYPITGFKKASIIAKAIKNIESVRTENDPLTIIMAFSGDPIADLDPFIDFIEKINKEVTKAETILINKKNNLSSDINLQTGKERYEKELDTILRCEDKVERMI